MLPRPLGRVSARSEAPIAETVSSKLLTTGSFLRRGAVLRYRRLVGLPWVECGIVAVLGRREPVTINRLAELLGMDKAQLSRALSALVDRKLVVRGANPRDSREVLVGLSPAGLLKHDTMVSAGMERNATLLAGLSASEIALLGGVLDRLAKRASEMLHYEQQQESSPETPES